jgi:hypothetical protein
MTTRIVAGDDDESEVVAYPRQAIAIPVPGDVDSALLI